MAFNIWADEQMQTLYGVQNGNNRLKPIVFTEKGAQQDIKFFLGSPEQTEKLVTVQNSGVDKVTLQIKNAMPPRMAKNNYAVGDVVEPEETNGFLYRCITAGVSGENKPVWIDQVNSNTADGEVVWRCIGEKEQINSVRLALSESDLDNAQGGAPLAIATEIVGGSAIAIYVRIQSDLKHIYSLLDKPQLSLTLNESQVVAV